MQLEAGFDQSIERHDVPQTLVADSGEVGDHFRVGRRPTSVIVRIEERQGSAGDFRRYDPGQNARPADVRIRPTGIVMVKTSGRSPGIETRTNGALVQARETLGDDLNLRMLSSAPECVTKRRH